MLTSLFIENFAIVSKLELDFTSGMSVFTGETGAGKSIMIDALMLALGERADASVVRSQQEKCEIHAHFTFEKDSLPMQWLKAHDVLGEENQILLRRVIFAEGRSKSTINGIPFPLQKVKELSETLVDIHGQHQHQTLLKHATHRQQLDQYAENHALLSEVARLYKICMQLKNQLATEQNPAVVQEKIALLQYQIDELLLLDLKEGEIESLNQEHQLLHHARDYLAETQAIDQLLNADDSPNIRQGLNEIATRLSSLPTDNSNIQNAALLINNALIQCDEAVDEIEKFVGQIQLDPERLYEVEERISALHLAARKYHVDINQLSMHLKSLQAEYNKLKHLGKDRDVLALELQKAMDAYNIAALNLRESRLKSAKKLAEEITLTIQKLGMPKGYILIEITPLDKIEAHGLDKVEYKVCTNPGVEPDLLQKIASGGELSRISLAIQLITAEKGCTPTLLFDEVDVGIGGATAALVGKLLRQLGQRLQLFCVTHQPQVASCANQHFLVEKAINDTETYSTIRKLSEQEKVKEIARMLGGLTITEHTLNHARELLLEDLT